MSEIDDIFSSKGKGKVATVTSSTSDTSYKKKKKEKRKKRSDAERVATDSTPTPDDSLRSPKKRPAPEPETVVDPSIQPSSSKKIKTSNEPAKVKKSSKRATTDKDDFSDSRGTGPRRTTEEGWSIFKEDELGIHDEGGDTPLCPFDCKCCF